MKKIKKIRIKNTKDSFLEYPIAVDAANVDLASKKNLETEVDKIDEKANKVKSFNVTIPVSGWIAANDYFTQEVNVADLPSDGIVLYDTSDKNISNILEYEKITEIKTGIEKLLLTAIEKPNLDLNIKIEAVGFTIIKCFPHAKGTELDNSLIKSNINSLTGIVSFTNKLSPIGEDYSLAKDGSIKCVIEGQNATISGDGGILSPNDSANMFSNSQASLLDLSSFDTSKVNNMYRMFNAAKSSTLILSSFDTANVTTMFGMFDNSLATMIDLSSFDTSNVTDMSNMFHNSKATILDLSSFDTSNVTDMSNMFAFSQATTINLSSFDTSNVTDMNSMFYSSQATILDLSSFDTSKVTNISWMFWNSQATKIYCRTEKDKQRFLASEGCTPTAEMFIVGKPPVV